MIVVVNGKETSVTVGATLLTLLEEKTIAPESVVVELNKDIIPADSFGETKLNDGDHLEVLRFVGGG